MLSILLQLDPLTFIDKFGMNGIFILITILLGKYFLKHAEFLQKEVLKTKDEVIAMQINVISNNSLLMQDYAESNTKLFGILEKKQELDNSLLKVNNAILETLEKNHSECPNKL